MQPHGRVSWKVGAIARNVLFAFLCVLFSAQYAEASSPSGVRVGGPGAEPQLAFACCDQGIASMQALFHNPEVVANLRDMRAQVVVAVVDLSPERAQIIQFLNQQQIPVIAGLAMPAEEGYYFNAGNAAEAPARIAAFEKWTRAYGLRWAAIGLDIEPNFAQLAALKRHPWRLIATLLGNSVNGGRIARAQDAYSVLVRQLQSQGYPVETYVMPYVPAENSIDTRLLDRMFGTFELGGSEEVVMVYTSYARSVGSAILLYRGLARKASRSASRTARVLPAPASGRSTGTSSRAICSWQVTSRATSAYTTSRVAFARDFCRGLKRSIGAVPFCFPPPPLRAPGAT